MRPVFSAEYYLVKNLGVCTDGYAFIQPLWGCVDLIDIFSGLYPELFKFKPFGLIMNRNYEKNGTDGKSIINFLAIVNISVYYSVFKMLYL